MLPLITLLIHGLSGLNVHLPSFLQLVSITSSKASNVAVCTITNDFSFTREHKCERVSVDLKPFTPLLLNNMFKYLKLRLKVAASKISSVSTVNDLQ